jgi:coproporphyrinogen III oxidase-like Fe-S oxidoreductase
MLGLYKQDLKDFLDSLQKTIDLDLDIITINPLTFYSAGHYITLQTMFDVHRESFLYGADILVARAAADIMLRECGYVAYNGFDYQKKMSPFPYFADYYESFYSGDNLVAAGHKTGSHVHPFQYGNYNKIHKYLDSLEKGRLPIAAGCRTGEASVVSRHLIGRFLLSDEIDYHAFRVDYSQETMKVFDALMEEFEYYGMIMRCNGIYRKTFSAFLFINEILKKIFHLGASPFDCHSRFLGKEQCCL